MTDIPVIMSAPMVLATLREIAAPGTGKTETRRLAWDEHINQHKGYDFPPGHRKNTLTATPWQKVKPGDRLWVREGWKPHSIYAHMKPKEMPRTNVFYLADGKYEPSNVAGRPSIHMPRWASRLTLIVTATKMERLQKISEADATREGLRIVQGDGSGPGPGYKWSGPGYHGAGRGDRGPTFHVSIEGASFGHRKGKRCCCKVGGPTPAQCAFRELWDSLHGAGAWDANPEVVAVSFKPFLTNIDAMPRSEAA